MPITLNSIAVRSPTRLRLTYSQALTLGAYDAAFFSVQCLDNSTADPEVVNVFLITTMANQSEIVLGSELSPGGSYQLTSLAGIPAFDGSFTSYDVTAFHVPSAKRPAPSQSVSSDDISATLYGVDLRYDGGDLVETADGDLDTVTGPENAIGAIVRIGLSDGLPYSSTYGAKLRKYVDAPSPSARSARGDLERAIRRDDRVKRITAAVEPDANDGDLTIRGEVTLIGRAKHSFAKAMI